MDSPRAGEVDAGICGYAAKYFHERIRPFDGKTGGPSRHIVTRFLVKFSPERFRARVASSRTTTWAYCQLARMAVPAVCA
jgi:hypothetical protein